MPSTTTLTGNPLSRHPSPIVERSPVLSPKTAGPRQQQRSGSVHPSSPPQRTSTPPQPLPDQKTENGSHEPEPIDEETFEQILELDDDDFAWEMATAYMIQADGTFGDMEAAIANKNYKELSSLGHFLKGSSATLGVVKVRDSCELIQHYGNLRDEKTGQDLEPEIALSKISAALEDAREEFKEAEIWLRKWYEKAVEEGRIARKDEDE